MCGTIGLNFDAVGIKFRVRLFYYKHVFLLTLLSSSEFQTYQYCECITKYLLPCIFDMCNEIINYF